MQENLKDKELKDIEETIKIYKHALNKLSEIIDNTDNTDNTDNMGLLYEELTDQIIETFYDVYNELGYGFPEKVY